GPMTAMPAQTRTALAELLCDVVILSRGLIRLKLCIDQHFQPMDQDLRQPPEDLVRKKRKTAAERVEVGAAQRDEGGRPSGHRRCPAGETGPDGGLLREGGRPFEGEDRDIFSLPITTSDFDDSVAHEKKRFARPPLL